MNDQQRQRYCRHIQLPQMATIGQQRLAASKVFIVGCGGLGCTVIPLLAAAGVGHLVIADHDRVELSNLPRQHRYLEQDIGQFKVDVMARFIEQHNQYVQCQVVKQIMTEQSLLPLIHDCQVIVDCTDNVAAKKAINRVAVQTKTPLVFGTALRFEGQLTVFDSADTGCPCYACLFDSQGRLADESGVNRGVFSPLVGVIGAQQAAETIKLLTGMEDVARGVLVHYNSLTNTSYKITCQRNVHCHVCGS